MRLLPVLLVLAMPSAAQARIVVQKSIKGVELDMTTTQVRERLGAPHRVVYPKHPILGTTKRYDYGLTRIFFHRGPQGRVYTVTTTSPKEKTASGIGVGSTEVALRTKVKGLRCESFGGFRSCYVGALRPGRRVTDFPIRNGRVTRVTLGYVID